MKGKIYTLCITCLLLVFGCKKDEDSDKSIKDQVVGKWKIEKTSIKTYLNDVLEDEQTDTDYSAEDYIEFKSDGTLVIDDGDATPGTYSIDEESRTVTVTIEGETIPFTITRLDDTKFYLTYDQTETQNGIKGRGVIEFNFTK